MATILIAGLGILLMFYVLYTKITMAGMRRRKRRGLEGGGRIEASAEIGLREFVFGGTKHVRFSS